jgi:hypothetical protein
MWRRYGSAQAEHEVAQRRIDGFDDRCSVWTVARARVAISSSGSPSSQTLGLAAAGLRRAADGAKPRDTPSSRSRSG